MSNLTEWKDLSGKNNDFIQVNGMNTPKIISNSQNYLNGISFAKADGASALKLKAEGAAPNNIDQLEINNIKTVFCVFKDIDDTHTSSIMTSRGLGPAMFLGSDPSSGSGDGFTIPDFGTVHSLEGFWANSALHHGIKNGLTRVNGSQFTGYGRSNQYLRSTNAGNMTLMSVQLTTGAPQTGHGDSPGTNRSGCVLSGLGNARNHSSYDTNVIIYELIVYTGYIPSGGPFIQNGTTHGNVGSDTIFPSDGTTHADVIKIENYLKKKWKLTGSNSVPSDTPQIIPDVTRTDKCILSLHLDASNVTGLSHNQALTANNAAKAEAQVTSLGVQLTVVNTMKSKISGVDSSGKLELSSSLRNDLTTNITGTATEQRQKRNLFLKILFGTDPNLIRMKVKKSDLKLSENIKKDNIVVLNAGGTVSLSDFAGGSEAFYTILDDGEFINFNLNSIIFTFTRNDTNTNEKYILSASDWNNVSINTSSSYFNTSDPSNANNYLIPDDTILIANGDVRQTFVIGSVGDGNSLPPNIFLTAGNRVYLDNTQSNTAANQALQVDGGAYIKKDIWFSNNLNIADSGMILGDNTDIKSEEIVADSPLLIIGENNTSDNLLSGFINRYKDNSSNYKFTGLVRNTDSDKKFLLVNNVNPDTSNKDLDVTNFNTIATNTSNNYKDNYSSIYLTKLKGLSDQYVNSSVSAITTQGSVGISKNVYLGNSNNNNAQINIGNNTQISYDNNNDAKFKFSTNVDIDINATNNKSIDITSDNDFTYNTSNNYSLHVPQILTENITGNNTLSLTGASNEVFNGNLTIIAATNNKTFKGSYFIDSDVPKTLPYAQNFSKTINNNQTYINKTTDNENYYSSYNITSSNQTTNYKGSQKNIHNSDDVDKIYQKYTTYYKSDATIKGSLSEDLNSRTVYISGDFNINIPRNYHKTQTGVGAPPSTMTALNHNRVIKNNKDSILGNYNLTTNTYNRHFYNIKQSEYLANSIETLNSENNLLYSFNINKQIYDNNENKYNLVYDTYKGNINIRGNHESGVLTNHINNKYLSTLYKDSQETYNKDRTINISSNLNIVYNNQYTETLKKVVINSSPNLSTSAQTKYSYNLNSIVGDNGASHINKLITQTNSNIYYNTISHETYKSNLVLQSQASNIKYNINYTLSCNSSNNLIEKDLNITYNNNLFETIKNKTFSIRPLGGGSAIIPVECVIAITESNGIISSGTTHKLPTEYVPTDIVSNITLKRNDLILFNYTPGIHTYSLNTQGGTVSNIDYSCLNGIYKIDFA